MAVVKMEYNGETKEVKLSPQDTVMKALIVGATKTFSIYMDDFEFYVEDKPIDDPEQYDPDTAVFQIRPKSDAIDLKKLYGQVVTGVGNYIQKVSENVKQPEFKEAVMGLVQVAMLVGKQMATAALDHAIESEPEVLCNKINGVLEKTSGLKDTVKPEQVTGYLGMLKGMLNGERPQEPEDE